MFWFHHFLEARAEIKKISFFGKLNTPQFHFEISWPLKDGLRSGLELTIEQKAELFEIRRKILQERSNMRFQLKELDLMTPRENNSSKTVSFKKLI